MKIFLWAFEEIWGFFFMCLVFFLFFFSLPQITTTTSSPSSLDNSSYCFVRSKLALYHMGTYARSDIFVVLLLATWWGFLLVWKVWKQILLLWLVVAKDKLWCSNGAVAAEFCPVSVGFAVVGLKGKERRSFFFFQVLNTTNTIISQLDQYPNFY